MTFPTIDDDGAGRIDLSQSVNDVLLERPDAVGVFNALGIDACCGGDRSLRDAACEADVSVAALLDALARLSAAGEQR